MRKLLTAWMAALLLLALVAAPASAQPKPPKPPKNPYTYTATIDCGRGPVVVGSYDDLWADLEEITVRRRYQPVEWTVFLPGRPDPIHEVKPGNHQRTVACSYDDGYATGTVLVKKDLWFYVLEHRDRDRDRDDD